MATVFTEGRHAAEFLMSEGERAISRENAVIVPGQDFAPGTILEAAGDWYQALTPGGTPAGIALYGVKTTDDAIANTAIIARLAEVNGKLLTWPDGTDVDGGIEALANLNIIVR
jgi:hypothetical protein